MDTSALTVLAVITGRPPPFSQVTERTAPNVYKKILPLRLFCPSPETPRPRRQGTGRDYVRSYAPKANRHSN
jgi:hypothetical protein